MEEIYMTKYNEQQIHHREEHLKSSDFIIDVVLDILKARLNNLNK